MCNVYHSFDLSTDLILYIKVLIFSTEFCFKLFLRIFFQLLEETALVWTTKMSKV